MDKEAVIHGPADSGCSLPGDPRRAPESIQAGCAMQAGWPPCGSPHGRDKVPLCSALWLALSRTLLLSAFFFFFFKFPRKVAAVLNFDPKGSCSGSLRGPGKGRGLGTRAGVPLRGGGGSQSETKISHTCFAPNSALMGNPTLQKLKATP